MHGLYNDKRNREKLGNHRQNGSCTIALPDGLKALKKWEIHGLFRLTLKNRLTDDTGAVKKG